MVNPPYQIADNLKHAKIVHGFFGAEGGYSNGVFESLNCGLNKGDDNNLVLKNRELICQAMDIKQMVTLKQIHKNGVLVVDANTINGHEYDAMVTSTPKLLLAIQTADCAPILLHDPVNNVIGAIHAGWRSAVMNIVDATITSMESLGANRKNINAAIGPCIQKQSYEVGAEVFEATNACQFFTNANKLKHYFFDLSGYLHNQLKKCGIQNILELGLDTYSLEKQYFSCRRAYHKEIAAFGIQLSVISIC